MTNDERILKILKDAEALPFLFVGSGISMRYLGSENWENLLRLFASKADSSPYYFEKIREQAKQDLLSKEKNADLVSLLYPRIADLIEEAFNKTWFGAPEYEESRRVFEKEIRSGASPLKLEIAEYCKKLLDKSFILKEEVELLKELSPSSVAGIITTNYDCFLEKIFPEFEPYIGQDELIFDNHQAISEIYKIHGCCNIPESIILNSRDYAEFERKNAYLAAKLLTIFVEHPVIFLGYSIRDENVQKILQAIINCLNGEKLSRLKNRLIFVEWAPEQKSLEVSSYSKDFGNRKAIDMTRVTLNDYCELFNIILQNKSKYPTKLLRQIKQDIYNLTLTTDPKTRLVALNMSSRPEDDQIEYVFGIGILEVGKIGYKSITVEKLYRDIIFDDANYIVDFIVEDTISQLMSTCSVRIPVFKYFSKYQKQLPTKYERFFAITFGNFSTREIRRIRAIHPYKSIDDVVKKNNNMYRIMINIAALPQNEISIEDLHGYLKNILTENPDILEVDSNVRYLVKKLILIYDYLKNKSK